MPRPKPKKIEHYKRRYHISRKEDLQQSIGHLEEAVQVYTIQDNKLSAQMDLKHAEILEICLSLDQYRKDCVRARQQLTDKRKELLKWTKKPTKRESAKKPNRSKVVSQAKPRA